MFAKIENNRLSWYQLLKKHELPVSDIIWAYLQQEDVHGRFCCGNANFPIGRLIVMTKDKKLESFQFEGLDKPKELLAELQQLNREMAVGFTEENKARFMA